MSLQIIDSNMAPIVAGAAGAAQINVATLAAVAGKLNYVAGFDISGGGATAASIIEAVLAGITGGSLKYEMAVQAGVTSPANASAIGGLAVRFPDPIPATALNTAITLTVPSFGAGNTNASVVLYGFQK